MFEQILRLIDTGGYWGIFAAMFAENVFPPIPSELIMPLAGFHAAQGNMSLLWVIVSGSLGATVGAAFWYYIGWLIGPARIMRFAERHGRFLTLSPADLQRAIEWFDRHGNKAVFLGRLVPGLRSLISIPAGIARMPLGTFLGWTAIGSTIWTIFLALGGYWLESQYSRIAGWVDPVSTGVIVAFVVVYIYRVVTWKPH